MMKKHLEIFISYAHEDELLKKHLEKHLTALRRQGFITIWHDHNISAGTEWAHEINIRLDASDIILLLISASFLASDYCYSVEMKQAMRRHELGLARAILIILRPVDWKNAPFSNLQALPTNAQPVTGRGWRNRDEAFANIAQGIRSIVEEIRSQGENQSQRWSNVLPEQSMPSTLSSLSIPVNFTRPTERDDQQKTSDEKSFFRSGLQLSYKQKLRAETSGMVCEVEKYLASSGQGEIYRVSIMGQAVALKWYYPHHATPERRNHLQVLIKRGSPSENFLWPMELVSASSPLDFGYIMPLREERHHNIVDLMRRRITTSFHALATAGFELAQSFFLLHAKGLCYHDISFSHISFDPLSGEILLHNADDIVLSGSPGAVLGTPRFMAPELIRHEVSPSIYTDLYSLAVLFFYLLMFHHPLEGKKEFNLHILAESAMQELYATHPVFIFDPNDHSNEPILGYHDSALNYWPLYPQFLRDRFIQAFTRGLKDPIRGRVREDEWRAAFVRLRDSIYYCSSCYAENFYDIDAFENGERKYPSCWSCHKESHPPIRLAIGKAIIMLNSDTKLYPHHIDDRRMYDFSSPIAEVTRHPVTSDVWGLKNLSDEQWTYARADGTSGELDASKSIALVSGTKLHFGTRVGEIQL
jgi:eukaryotic-like serine/threonine-protein kinase